MHIYNLLFEIFWWIIKKQKRAHWESNPGLRTRNPMHYHYAIRPSQIYSTQIHYIPFVISKIIYSPSSFSQLFSSCSSHIILSGLQDILFYNVSHLITILIFLSICLIIANLSIWAYFSFALETVLITNSTSSVICDFAL